MPFELLSWCHRWATPRKIHIGDGVEISSVHPGDNHTVMLSTLGQLFLCGSGHAIPQFLSHEDLSVDINTEGRVKSESAFSRSHLEGSSVCEAKVPENSEADTEVADGADDNGKRLTSLRSNTRYQISSPRCPSDIWLTKLYTRRAIHVASSGSKVFVVLNDEIIADSMAKLCKRAVFGTMQAIPRHIGSVGNFTF